MRLSTLMLLTGTLMLTACEGDGNDTDMDTDTGVDTDTDTMVDVADIELAGTYTSFGDTHIITSVDWVQSGSFDDTPYENVFDIVEYDNTLRFALAQNGSDNGFNPDLYSRFDWSVNADGDYVYCQIAFDAADLEAARGAGDADPDDLAAGCNGFGWSVLTPVAE